MKQERIIYEEQPFYSLERVPKPRENGFGTRYLVKLAVAGAVYFVSMKLVVLNLLCHNFCILINTIILILIMEAWVCCCNPQGLCTCVEVAYSVCCPGIVKCVVLMCKVCCVNVF